LTCRRDLERREISYGWHYTVEGRGVDGGPTRILELVENHKLVTDWPDWRGDPAKPSTRVTWLLEPLAGGKRTRLTIVHDGFAHAADRGDYQQGWAGSPISWLRCSNPGSAAGYGVRKFSVSGSGSEIGVSNSGPGPSGSMVTAPSLAKKVAICACACSDTAAAPAGENVLMKVCG
jgi:hypothetical protein